MILLVCLYLLATTVYGAQSINASVSPDKSQIAHAGRSDPSVEQLTGDVTKLPTKVTSKVLTAIKREIPDALVDHPEDFEESDETADDREDRFEGPFGGNPIVDKSRLDDEMNEYPHYGVDSRRKRTVGVELGRMKRGSDIDEDQVEELLSMLSRGHYFYHMPQRSMEELRRDFDDSNRLSDDEEPIEYLEPVRDEYWPSPGEFHRKKPYKSERHLLPGYRHHAE